MTCVSSFGRKFQIYQIPKPHLMLIK